MLESADIVEIYAGAPYVLGLAILSSYAQCHVREWTPPLDGMYIMASVKERQFFYEDAHNLKNTRAGMGKNQPPITLCQGHVMTMHVLFYY